MATYDENRALILNNKSYLGTVIDREKMNNNYMRELKDSIESKREAGIEVRSYSNEIIDNIKEGNIVKIKSGRGYHNKYNKTPYRVYCLNDYTPCEDKKYCVNSKVRHIFLEPFSNKAKSVRMVVMYPKREQNSKYILNDLYNYSGGVENHSSKTNKENPQKCPFEDSKDKLGGLKIISDGILSEVYDFNTKKLISVRI